MVGAPTRPYRMSEEQLNLCKSGPTPTVPPHHRRSSAAHRPTGPEKVARVRHEFSVDEPRRPDAMVEVDLQLVGRSRR
jgi:hypothetical protein